MNAGQEFLMSKFASSADLHAAMIHEICRLRDELAARSTPMAGAEPTKQGEATQVGELYAALEALLDAHQGGQVAPIEGADGYVSSLVERGEAAIANAPQAQQVAPLGIDDVFKATAANGETCHFGTERGATIWAGTGGKVERIALRSLSLAAAPSVEPAPAACCQDFENCQERCLPLANYWKGLACQVIDQLPFDIAPAPAPHQEPGWVRVPVEPTMEMLREARDTYKRVAASLGGFPLAETRAYQALIAAAPKEPKP